jgi:hypothetical protein
MGEKGDTFHHSWAEKTNEDDVSSIRSAPPAHRRVQSLYPTTPISKHYALNNQILAAFDSLYSQKSYKVAYAIGMQFVEMALIEIPKHGYFYSRRHDAERIQNAEDAVRVTRLLESLLQEEELAVEATTEVEAKKVHKLVKLANAQVYDKANFEMDRALLEQEFKKQGGLFESSFCGLFHDYAELVAAAVCPVKLPLTPTKDEEQDIGPSKRPSTVEDEFRPAQQKSEKKPTSKKESSYRLPTQDEDRSMHYKLREAEPLQAAHTMPAQLHDLNRSLDISRLHPPGRHQAEEEKGWSSLDLEREKDLLVDDDDDDDDETWRMAPELKRESNMCAVL